MVAESLQDNFIDEDTYNLYDNHEEVKATPNQGEPVKDMRTAIKRNSIRISGLDGSYRSLQQNFEMYCRRILALLLHDDIQHGTDEGSCQENLSRYPQCPQGETVEDKD